MLEKIERYIWSYNASDASARYSFWRHFLQIVVINDVAAYLTLTA